MNTPTLGGWMVHVMRESDSALSLEESLHCIMESVATFFPCQSVAVILIDDTTKELRIKISRQISYTFVKKFRREGPSPTAERVVLEQAPLLLNDVDVESEVYREVKLEHDFVSAVMAPVVKNQRGVGYIFCDRKAGAGPFTQADLLHLQVIGYLIGNHIEKFELVKQSKKLSRFDDATGILQYKAFIPALGVEFERARKHGYDVVLALLAVGAFRKYVETYGIDRAHALLADVAKMMGQRLSEMDLLARFGADEIVVCMSGQTAEEAAAKLQAMREDVRRGVIGETDEPVDVAIGALHLSGERDLKRVLQEVLAELGKSLVEAKTKHAGAVVLRELGAQGQG